MLAIEDGGLSQPRSSGPFSSIFLIRSLAMLPSGGHANGPHECRRGENETHGAVVGGVEDGRAGFAIDVGNTFIGVVAMAAADDVPFRGAEGRKTQRAVLSRRTTHFG
jgi:hypothetical protein